MHLQENSHLLSLLVRLYNCTIMDFYYFPEVILADKQKIEKEDFLLLKEGGYLDAYRYDSFGRFYKLSDKAIHMLYQEIVLKASRKKRMVATTRQPELQFAH